jgi:hypothetical protein
MLSHSVYIPLRDPPDLPGCSIGWKESSQIPTIGKLTGEFFAEDILYGAPAELAITYY